MSLEHSAASTNAKLTESVMEQIESVGRQLKNYNFNDERVKGKIGKQINKMQEINNENLASAL